ncbi:hypothetical protein FA15DRAFT_683670 [Coprinopsis marcescibilis]|uniref:Aspartic peptidase DDI1-type domain-containing protein n=1 Tax=Coprinopsis marcescibilis TaxID=230819 RepID=A0A5C3K9K6_COPMA|nr:hypothetical protein FA15DRAFT_683670 [Coprinopsis marcescibilis]
MRLLVPKPIVVVLTVNGHPVRALLDSGSLGDFILTAIVDQLKLKRKAHETPIPLHLAMQGSKTKITASVEAKIQYQTIRENRTFHVINVSNYNMILGTLFLYQHQVYMGLNPARAMIGSEVSLPIEQGVETKPVISSIEYDDPKVKEARALLTKLAEPLCKGIEETGLPPMHVINHEIPLLDVDKVYSWRLSRCLEMF